MLGFQVTSLRNLIDDLLKPQNKPTIPCQLIITIISYYSHRCNVLSIQLLQQNARVAKRVLYANLFTRFRLLLPLQIVTFVCLVLTQVTNKSVYRHKFQISPILALYNDVMSNILFSLQIYEVIFSTEYGKFNPLIGGISVSIYKLCSLIFIYLYMDTFSIIQINGYKIFFSQDTVF